MTAHALHQVNRTHGALPAHRSTELRAGLTLMEMVVVLAILAAMATAATVATERVLYGRRFEMTRETLDSAAAAVLGKSGPGQSTNEAPEAEGFVADIGRLPLAVGAFDYTADPATAIQSAELWTNPRNLVPYGRKTSAIDPEVSLNCGWRGPYLNLPLGATSLTDGWGRQLIPITTDAAGIGHVTLPDEPIAGWRSLGSDGLTDDDPSALLNGPVPLTGDLSKPLWNVSGSPATVGRYWSANITVTVNQLTSSGNVGLPQGTGSIIIRLFGPNGTTGDIVSFVSAPIEAPFTTYPSVTFNDVAIGTKAIRAYYQESSVDVLKTDVVEIKVSRTGTSRWTLTLPAPVVAPPSGGGP